MIKDKKSSLPTGWAWAPIIELGGKPQYGWTTKAQNEGNLKFLRTTDISSGEVNWDTVPFCKDEPADVEKYLVAKNDIVVSRAGSVGKSFIIQKPLRAVFASYMVRIRPKTNPNYLYHFMQSLNYWVQIWDKSTGIAIPNVNGTKLGQIELPVPPLAEQERIVDRIDELFSSIEAGERAIAQARTGVARYRKAILKAAVTGELTADWRNENPAKESAKDLLARILTARYEAWEKSELAKLDAKGKARPETEKQWEKFRARYKAPVEPDIEGLPDLPDGWLWVTLPQLGEFGRGKSKHRPRGHPSLYGGEYPFLQTGRIRNSNGRIRAFDKTYNEKGLAQSRLWPKGTVCITIAANIAETGILDFDACFPDSVVGLIPHPDLGPEYPEFFLRTARDNLDRYAPGSAQKNINLGILEKVSVPFPSKAEQAEIVNRVEQALSKADAVDATLDAQSRAAKALKQAVLKTAFEGKLVSQNPKDEPASELLKRIKAAS